jgi:hypothetical protein
MTRDTGHGTVVRGAITLSCDCAVAGVLLIASISKLVDPTPAAHFVHGFVAIDHSTVLVQCLAVIEWALAIALIAGSSPSWARMSTGALLIFFVLVLGFVQIRGDANTCPCLGRDTSIPLAIGRNGLLLGALVAALVLESNTTLTVRSS